MYKYVCLLYIRGLFCINAQVFLLDLEEIGNKVPVCVSSLLCLIYDSHTIY
jgi:hypothetical protein